MIGGAWNEEKRQFILSALLKEKCVHVNEAMAELGLEDCPMVVVCAEKYNENMPLEGISSVSHMLVLSGAKKEEVMNLEMEGCEVIVLKGRNAIDRFYNLVRHYREDPQDNSLMDMFYISYGNEAHNSKELAESYKTAFKLIRFRHIMNSSIHINGPEKKMGVMPRENVITDVLWYVENNYGRDLKLEKIASKFGYNSAYLGRIFKNATGESFNSYVERIRIKNACDLLKSSGLKVYEIAEKIGYKNVDYFHIKFHRLTGMSPAEYKKKTDNQEG